MDYMPKHSKYQKKIWFYLFKKKEKKSKPTAHKFLIMVYMMKMIAVFALILTFITYIQGNWNSIRSNIYVMFIISLKLYIRLRACYCTDSRMELITNRGMVSQLVYGWWMLLFLYGIFMMFILLCESEYYNSN